MEEFYKNSIKKIKDFYTEKIDETNINTKLFEVLKSIIPFERAHIYYLNGKDRHSVYFFGQKSDNGFTCEEQLCIAKIPFGVIEIQRSTEFNADEIAVFRTCSAIIANIIKDYEMNSIMRMQVGMLQDGIQEKSREYKRILEEEKAKNQFIANVSHELRSPLNSIMGFAELLQTQFAGKLNEKQLEYTDDIRIAGLHLLGMVNEILDMSKIESGTMKVNLTRFSLSMNVKEVLNILQPLFLKKKHEVNVNVPENIEITADYQKIQQILFNLLSNAIKYTPENGTINIKAEQTNAYTTIHIIDNGCGIDKKNHKRIFNKFEQISETSFNRARTHYYKRAYKTSQR